MSIDFRKRLDKNDGKTFTQKFFDPIPREPWKGFSDANKKCKIVKNDEVREVAVRRDIDIDKALGFPLAPVDLSISSADVTRR